jgi:hypothetical protein
MGLVPRPVGTLDADLGNQCLRERLLRFRCAVCNRVGHMSPNPGQFLTRVMVGSSTLGPASRAFQTGDKAKRGPGVP